MNKTLYILTNTVRQDQKDSTNCILPSNDQHKHLSTHVFIQGGLAQQDRVGDVMYGIQDAEHSMSEGNVLERVSYYDLLGLIFDSNNVVVL